MTAPNITTVTASIERSLQNCSLNNHHHHHHQHQSSSSSTSSSSSSSNSNINNTGGGEGIRQPGFDSDSQENLHVSNDNLLELNSGSPLPYYWEQCLDLKTGEVYFINWRTGMKSQEDPRTNPELNGEFYSGDDSSYDSEGSSSESSPSTSREPYQFNPRTAESNDRAQVLVVAGCKSCLMYFMVPKQVEDCPKCYGQLLHFDRSESGSP